MDLVIKCDLCAIVAAPLRKGRSSKRYAVFGLVGVLGVLAFIFSSVSPGDDEIQQEFIQQSRNRQRVVLNWKTAPCIRGTLLKPVHYAFVLRGLPSFCCSTIGRVHISDIKIGAIIFRSRAGGRSPPVSQS